MIGKASEIKTIKVTEGSVGVGKDRKFYSLDDLINIFLSETHPDTEIISIQYQTAINQIDYDHHALIIYKEVKENE